MRKCIVWFVLLLPFWGYSQDCTGNVGANIFEDGDFGRGAANVLAMDPGISPGYTYTTNVPPDDGEYTITNNTGVWNLFPGWMPIINSSSDELGYMMVVNASVTPGIFFERTINDLCADTDYQFTTDIINLISPGYEALIKPRVQFLLNGEVFFDTGEIDQNGRWNTYGFTVSTGPGETSLTLTLRNNAPGGQGNDLALDNITFRPCGPEALILPREPDNICEDGNPVTLSATISGDQFPDPVLQWQQSFDEGGSWENISGATGLNYQHTNLRAGDYYYRYYLAKNENNLANAKCRIFSNTKVVRVIPRAYTIRDTICSGLSYFFGGRPLTEDGVYVDSLISSIGCDSIVTLFLTKESPRPITYELEVEPVSCAGQTDGAVDIVLQERGYSPVTIEFNGQSVDADLARFTGLAVGTYPLKITDRIGCSVTDSITVVAPPPLQLKVTADSVIGLGDVWTVDVQLNQPVERLVWMGDTTGACVDRTCFPWQWRPLRDAVLIWEAATGPACVVRDTIRVRVEARRDVFIPNAFSPNGDGRNDFFSAFAKTAEVHLISTMRIFDRWGNLTFEGEGLPVNSPSSGWDGRSLAGQLLPQGVYTYQIILEYIDGVQQQMTGTVMLVR